MHHVSKETMELSIGDSQLEEAKPEELLRMEQQFELHG